ncbi:MAG: tRNA (guanosine(46)-N7)-methyltransferase TrmB [Oscillospiraceae bacterium]|jgi:tRNA (guanine-N7-)-methyltransferase|nr:tRNA (guanosine(46)-N7)-methyltransferase TrmB [Oscillospiraceae bacterium]
MRIRKKKWAEPELALCDYFIKTPEDFKGRWQTAFAKPQPLHLEIGCGKCTFIAQLALHNPDVNFLAIDIKPDMLGVGRRNIEQLYAAMGVQTPPQNLRLACKNVEQIYEIIAPPDEVQRLYINFCNPWPKEKHKKRRLTYPKKLDMYAKFLSPTGEIHFKTDDDDLFAESLEYFEQSGYKTLFLTQDLHSLPEVENIMTEHEQMFSQQGIKIKKAVFVPPKKL